MSWEQFNRDIYNFNPNGERYKNGVPLPTERSYDEFARAHGVMPTSDENRKTYYTDWDRTNKFWCTFYGLKPMLMYEVVNVTLPMFQTTTINVKRHGKSIRIPTYTDADGLLMIEFRWDVMGLIKNYLYGLLQKQSNRSFTGTWEDSIRVAQYSNRLSPRQQKELQESNKPWVQNYYTWNEKNDLTWAVQFDNIYVNDISGFNFQSGEGEILTVQVNFGYSNVNFDNKYKLYNLS